MARRKDRQRRQRRRDRNQHAQQAQLAEPRLDNVARAQRRQLVLHDRGGLQVEFIFGERPEPGVLGRSCVRAEVVTVTHLSSVFVVGVGAIGRGG